MRGWTIGRKITAAVLVVLFQALGVAVYGLWTANQTKTRLNLLSSLHLPERELAARIETELLNARIHFVYYVTIQKEGSLDEGLERFRNAQRELPNLRELINNSPEFVELRSDVEQLNADFNSYVLYLQHARETIQKGQNHGPELDAIVKEWARLGDAMVASAERLSHHGSQATDDLIRSASSQLGVAAVALGFSCLASLLLGIAMSFALTRNISGALRKVISKLGETSRQVAHAAAQISGSSKSVAEGASQQAASLEETSASSEEISSMANSNQENAVLAAANMAEVSGTIEEANRNLTHLEVSMSEINASSDKISKIIKVIDEIAFQTNILALNAAVEAARAGEAGMGFAVVANEVRNLAQRCAEAARDTSSLIEESITRSREGKNKLDQMSIAVHSITDSAGKVKKLVDQVQHGSQEQSRGIEQVVRSITQIENVTHTAAASAEENAAASEELKMQSETLRRVIDQLDVMIGNVGPASGS